MQHLAACMEKLAPQARRAIEFAISSPMAHRKSPVYGLDHGGSEGGAHSRADRPAGMRRTPACPRGRLTVMDDQRLSQLLEDTSIARLAPPRRWNSSRCFCSIPRLGSAFGMPAAGKRFSSEWGAEHWGREGLKLAPFKEAPQSLACRPSVFAPFRHLLLLGRMVTAVADSAGGGRCDHVLATWGLYVLLPRSIEYRQTAASDPRGSGVAVLRRVAGAVWPNGTPPAALAPRSSRAG